MKKEVLRHIYRYAWMLLAFLHVFSSCNRIEDDLVFYDEVRLTASLSPALSAIYTKGDGEIKSTHAGELEIGVAKAFTVTDGVNTSYNFNNAENPAALRAVMGTPSDANLGLRDIKFDDFQGFPDASTELNYIAWYPFAGSTYSNPDTGNTTVSFDIPTDASTDILYSDVASGTRLSRFNTMTFQHALVKYTIKVYAMESDENPGSVSDVWGKIKSVTFEDMPSTCLLKLPTESERTPSVSYPGNLADLMRNAPSGLDKIPVGFSNATDLTYFLAPPPSNNENILKIKVITEKSPSGKNVQTSIARDFQPGKHYQIYLRFTTHGIISADVVAGDWIDNKDYLHVDTNSGIYYDLSESHSSNTYVVSSAYSYCFDATVRGNGYTGIAGIPGAAADVYKVGNPVSAEIVWTDLVDSSKNMDEYFTLSPYIVDGRVFFDVKPVLEGESTLKKEGNVVIGVRDAFGNMLWTWHIWITDRPVEQGYKNGFNVQDRDLGATSYNAEKEPAGINGFYYQWGRPTPLPLDRTVYKPNYDDDGRWVSNTEVEFSSSDALLSIVDRVATPTVFYNTKATASEGTLTKSLWGWRTETDEYAKTIYDPCPPGYRMPSAKLWRDLVIWDENKDGKHDATLVKYGEVNIATKFKVDVNHTEVYYPMTGYYTTRNNYVNKNRGAYMWAATFELGALNNLDDDAPYALSFRLEDGSQTDLKEMQTQYVPSNYAMPVRCISRMSKAHVTNLSDYQTANSYIVSKNGFYKFKATVRGNGVGQLVSPGSTSTIVLTEQLQSVDIKSQLVKVEPLWWIPAAGTGVTSPAFSILNNGAPDADGYVTFELETFSEGNLVLAGYDAKGEIIWSWHLWFTDEPAMKKSNSFVVMDRNLGATYAPDTKTSLVEPTGNDLKETYGLYYQWGRKDPFPIPVTDAVIYKYNGGVYSEMAVSYPAPESAGNTAFKTNKTASIKTVEHSVKNPMTFHLASNWTSTRDDLIYQDSYGYLYKYFLSSYSNSENQCFSNMLHPEYREALWGYSALANTYGVTTTKTMYDPCPPGYVVSYYLVWTNTERSGTANKLYYTNLDDGFKSHGLTAGTYGLFINNGLQSTDPRYDIFDKTWYPYSGYMSGKDGHFISGSLNNDGTYGIGIFHTSTPAGNSSRNITYSRMQSGQGIEGSSHGLPSTCAYPVRCQKE